MNQEVYNPMTVNPQKGSPDVEQYPKHDQFTDLPVIPRAERKDWIPFRPICEQLGYDLPRSFDEGWVVRIYDWRFERIIRERGQANPGRLMIHKSWLTDFRQAAGVEVGPDDLLDLGSQFLKALDEANDAFDAALEVRIAAQDQVEEECLNALADLRKIIPAKTMVRSQGRNEAPAVELAGAFAIA